jgi:hypothetical protein
MIEVTKRECLQCEGVAYFTKLVGEPAFCPMCGCEMDSETIWQVDENVYIEEVDGQ